MIFFQLYYNQQMKGALGQGKQVILRRQYQRNFQGHLNRLRSVRPNSTGWQWNTGQPALNQQKKLMKLQEKITEIERQNRFLMQKITHTINKRNSKDGESARMNKSLNYSFRRKKLESIDDQNMKLLKRLREKTSSYQASKLKDQWIKQKEVIKNISEFPFILKDRIRKPRRKGLSKMQLYSSLNNDKGVQDIIRIRKINGINMIVTLKLARKKLIVLVDDKKSKNIKMIKIPRQQADYLISTQCQGQLQKMIDKLSYDLQKDQLSLNFQGQACKQLLDKDDIQQNEFLDNFIDF